MKLRLKLLHPDIGCDGLTILEARIGYLERFKKLRGCWGIRLGIDTEFNGSGPRIFTVTVFLHQRTVWMSSGGAFAFDRSAGLMA